MSDHNDLYSKTLGNSQVPKVVASWKQALVSTGKSKLSATIGDPTENPDLFEEGWDRVDSINGNGNRN